MDLAEFDAVTVAEPNAEYDMLTFEARDELDAEAVDRAREELTGLPARSGTLR
ncbi:hypothetical protein OG792_32955 [Micromonospora sp. NBC_01699]|uniref:hypothetical protein n=1 Tax=Micromonospora sp. NBC_01699 TaxID=2975984 RepID=UPI002E2A0D9D|nr:hypothetical protein [Micromonospora sp. NBC_01699]